MPWYNVEVIGEAREVYQVEANSEQEAMRCWANGKVWVSEITSAEPVSARLAEK